MSRALLATLLVSVAACQAFLSLDAESNGDASAPTVDGAASDANGTDAAATHDGVSVTDGGASTQDADAGVVVVDPRYFPDGSADACPPPGASFVVCPDAGEGRTVRWNNRCYFLTGGGIKFFSDGLGICKTAHAEAYPATATCAEEWQQMTGVGFTDITWLGYMASGGLPAWSTGEPFTFQAWDTATGSPHTDGKTDCILTGPNQGLKWQSTSCGAQGNIICEIGPVAQ